jgi:hypothetical protein|tara:strand:- start:243 stop:671 length:429 start_codon:yes stop_codon:yes gene_type:complete
MARRKKKRTRRSRSISLLNIAESYAYASILTEGLMGTSPWGVITGDTDIGYTRTSDVGLGRGSQMLTISGADQISLGDFVSNPELSFDAVKNNFMNSYVQMAISSLAVGVGFKFGKRLLRRPISNVNRNIFGKKGLNLGVRL